MCCDTCHRNSSLRATCGEPPGHSLRKFLIFGSIYENGRKYTTFGDAIISDRNFRAFHSNVVAFGKLARFTKPLQTDTRIKLVFRVQSRPDNIASRHFHPVA